jgi:RNA polymerase sigma-70 factor, ECF subfamily
MGDRQPGTDSRERFAAAMATHQTRLMAAARRILGNDHEAEDVVQETLAILWQRVDQLPQRLEAYAYRAVQFNALKRRARRKRQASLEGLEVAAPTEEERPSLEIDPLELEQALEGLPAGQQTVLRMKYYLDMTFAEIGEALSISLNTAASRCRYGLAKLARVLRDRPRKR